MSRALSTNLLSPITIISTVAAALSPTLFTTALAQAPPPACVRTELGPKCGTDVVNSIQNCGGTLQCKTDEIVFDNIFYCSTAQSGLSTCVARDCNKWAIKRKCQFFPGDPNEGIPGYWGCVILSAESTKIADGQQASGSGCITPPL